MLSSFDGRGLVLPGAGASPLKALRAHYLMIAVRAFAKLGPRLAPTARSSHRLACRLVKESLARNPAMLLDSFASPSIAAPLHCEFAGYADSPFRARLDAALERALAEVLAKLGSRPGATSPVPTVIAGFVSLTLDDPNPIAMLEEHPEKSGNAASLGGRPAEDWRRALTQALELIGSQLPGLHAEMRLLLRQIVPVGYHPQRHFSASYREAVGTIYLTLHPDVLTLAEAIIHEFQHNKLYLASHRDSLLKNAFAPLYSSPVRPDPRPLWGVLLAVHAFLPVAAMRRAMRRSGHPLASPERFRQSLEEIDGKNAEGMRTLKEHADWTSAGREIFQELDSLNRRNLANN